MPSTGGRRRGRGRVVKRETTSRHPSAAHSRTDTEVESQQQQSSNRTPSLRETELKQEEKQPGLQQNRRGGKRQGRPPSRGTGRRGRPAKEPRRREPVDGEEGQGGSNRKRNVDMGTHGSSGGNESGREMEREPIGGSARQTETGGRRRTIPAKGPSLMDDPSEMDVESEGENVVSDTEGSQLLTETRPFKSTERSQHSPFSNAPVEERSLVRQAGEESAADFPFPVFEDGRRTLRAKDATFVLPISVGTIALWLGKRAPEKKCYRWAVYVRSPGGVDLSHVIRRVKFQLHPSFPHPERIVERSPYVLEESGWGEFDILVSIDFHEDVGGPSVEMVHSLKLYTTSEPSTKRPVVNEKYDEIVFSEPPARFFERVRNAQDRKAPQYPFERFFPRYNSHLVDDCMHRITLVRSRIREEARALMAKAKENGIQVDITAMQKLIEQSAAKEGLSDKPPTACLSRKDGALSPEIRTKTRIVIDADNRDMPLSIQVEQSERKLAPERSGNAQPLSHNSDAEMVEDSIHRTQTPTVQPGQGEMAEVVVGEQGLRDADDQKEEMEVQPNVDEGATEERTFATDASDSKSSDMADQQCYDDILSRGEFPDRSAGDNDPGAMAERRQLAASETTSKVSNNNISIDGEESQKDSSGSSSGAASGTQKTPVDESFDVDKDV